MATMVSSRPRSRPISARLSLGSAQNLVCVDEGTHSALGGALALFLPPHSKGREITRLAYSLERLRATRSIHTATATGAGSAADTVNTKNKKIHQGGCMNSAPGPKRAVPRSSFYNWVGLLVIWAVSSPPGMIVCFFLGCGGGWGGCLLVLLALLLASPRVLMMMACKRAYFYKRGRDAASVRARAAATRRWWRRRGPNKEQGNRGRRAGRDLALTHKKKERTQLWRTSARDRASQKRKGGGAPRVKGR